MSTEESSLTRNQRIGVSAGIWLLIGPLVVAFFFMSLWFGLMMLAIAGLTTYDYIRRGGIAGHVTTGLSRHGFTAEGAQESFGRPDSD
jgi:4-hydroxybenzoate polyprenyltransferase